MSTKVIIWIVVILAVIAGVWYVWGRSMPAPSTGTPSTQGETMNQQNQSAGNSTNDTSDAALDRDLVQIDGQASAAASANTSAQSFSDTPVQQTE